MSLTNGKKRTILVVDDEEPIRFMLSEALQEQGYTVVLASSAEEGITRLGQQRIDVILTDLHLQGLSGLDLLRLVRDHSYDAPVILMTAYSSVYSVETAARYGAYGYLAKPFELPAVWDLVRRACACVRPSATDRATRATTRG
ncbi:MAG: response regulator [Planctomycetes bacterium]|nr:response regulator [Planctomycetota bacterium]